MQIGIKSEKTESSLVGRSRGVKNKKYKNIVVKHTRLRLVCLIRLNSVLFY